MNIPTLHIYAQYSHHAEARIVGDRLGLEALRDAIAYALKDDEAESRSVFANDGEGYTVQIICTDKTDELEPPYIIFHQSEKERYWQERAFDAEAKISSMKRAAAAPKGKK